MPKLFVSYSSDDKVAVTNISDRLKKEFYYDVWIDTTSIVGSEDWQSEIRKGIDTADMVLLLLTPDAGTSELVKKEVEYAKSIGRKILPLPIKKVSNAKPKYDVVEYLDYVDFVSSYDDQFELDITHTVKQDLPQLLKLCLPAELILPMERNNPEWMLIYYAARLFEHVTDQDLKDTYHPHLQKALTKLIEIGALAPVDRALTGRILGQLGDPRQGVGTMSILLGGKAVEVPQIEWCDVPAPTDGTFIMGSDDRWSQNPRRVMELRYGFKMAKYLVTCQQFKSFIDSGEYNDLAWWDGMPKKYQQEEALEPLFPFPNYPRNGLSWYQSVAFTRWLTAKYRVAEFIENDVVIRLPTDEEWEYAARGTDGRMYPYGDEFDAMKSNTRETGIRQTSPVGMFPDGMSPFGIHDMSGNAIEWCLNDYSKPEIVDGYGNGNPKLERGGSFFQDQTETHTSWRHCDIFARDFKFFHGLRVVLGSPKVTIRT